MILEISSAFMSIFNPGLRPRTPYTLSRGAPTPHSVRVARSLRSLALLARLYQRLFHFLELRRDAAIGDDAAEARHDAADNRRVYAGREHALPPGRAPEPLPAPP